MQQQKITFSKIKPTSVSAKILISLGTSGGLSRVYSKNKKLLRDTLDRLKTKGFIELDKQKGVRLSEAGFVEFLKLELSQADLLPEGKICIVVFDIPEETKDLRNTMRKFLKDVCFVPIQKSVWISQFNSAKSLAKIFEFLKIDKWVRVFIATEINTA